MASGIPFLACLALLLLLAPYWSVANSDEDDPWLKPNKNKMNISAFGREAHIVSGLLGIKYIVPRNDNVIGDSIRNFGHYEMYYSALAKEITQRHVVNMNLGAPIVFLDIGANIGSWSLPFAKYMGNNGYVYAIEAQQQLVKYLGASALLNGHINLNIRHAIVSNESTKISKLYDISNNKGVNFGEYSIEYMAGRISKQDSHGERVEIFSNDASAVRHVTLNDLYYEERAFSCPTLIKMDIECHEIDALIGSMRMLADCMPVLFMEAQCDTFLKSIFTILDGLGFAIAYVIVDIKPYFFGRHVFMGLDSDIISTIYPGPNIIAVPKSESEDIFEKFSDSLFPINESAFQRDEFNIKYQNIEVCVTTWTVFDKVSKTNINLLSHPDGVDPSKAFTVISVQETCKVLEHDACDCPNINDYFVRDFWKELI